MNQTQDKVAASAYRHPIRSGAAWIARHAPALFKGLVAICAVVTAAAATSAAITLRDIYDAMPDADLTTIEGELQDANRHLSAIEDSAKDAATRQQPSRFLPWSFGR